MKETSKRRGALKPSGAGQKFRAARRSSFPEMKSLRRLDRACVDSYEFRYEAEEELLESALFYDSRVKGLGESFTSEVQRAVQMIREHPDLGSPLGSKVRRVLVRRFPYSVIYRHQSDQIFVLAVAHQRRKPGYWKNRH